MRSPFPRVGNRRCLSRIAEQRRARSVLPLPQAHLRRAYATRRPDPAGRAETAALYASGHSVAKIADLLGLDPKTVRERLDRAGVTRRQPSQAVSAQVAESQERAILAGLADGATIFELARHHGLSSHTIQVIRNRHGLSGGRVMRRVRAGLPDRDVALTRRRRQVVALVVGEHLSSTEAARRLGIARSTVDMHLSAVAARLASRADETNP